MTVRRAFVLPLLFAGLLASAARAEKIGTVVSIQGNDLTQLSGMGLVVGLNGTGDKSAAALDQIRDFMVKYNINLKRTDLATGNIALVYVTAWITPANPPGQKVEARVSAVNGAKSLRDGYLMETPLQFGNASGDVYSVASGRLTVSPDNLCNAVLPNDAFSGALVVRNDGNADWDANGVVQLGLKRPNYADVVQIAKRINEHDAFQAPTPGGRETRGFRERSEPAELIARPYGSGSIRVQIPAHYRGREPVFLDQLLGIDVTLARPPTVRVNEAHGEVVLSGDIRVSRQLTFNVDGRVVTLTPPQADQARQYRDQDTQALVEAAGHGSTPDLQELIGALRAMGVSGPEIARLFKRFVLERAIWAELVEES